VSARVALFGKSEEKVAEDQAAAAEAERLESLSAAELALILMPAFGPEGPKPDSYLNQLQIGMWLMSSYPRGTKYIKDLRESIMEGLQDLENAGLIVGRSRGGTASLLKATRLGEEALAEGTVDKYLRGPAAPNPG
jgi:hypothetical protein